MTRSDLEIALAFQMRAARLPPWEEQFVFVPGRRFRADFAWPDRRLLCEVDGATWSGGRHARGSGIERDSEKYSLAAALGYRVVRVTRSMVESGRALDLIERALEYEEVAT